MASKFAAARGSRLPHTVQRYSRLGRRGASAGGGGVAAVVSATATSAVHSSALGLTVTSMLTTEVSTRV